MAKEIKAIIFDAARVLMNFDTNIFVKAIKPFSSYSEEEILSKIINSEVLKDFDKGRISSEYFHKKLADILKLEDLSFETFKVEWQKILYWSNDDLSNIFSQIKPEIKLLVIANMDELSWAIFTNFPLIRKYFPDKNQRIVSCETGYAKPEMEIYNEALRRFSTSFNDCLFIDDNHENLRQIKNLGGNTINYDCRIHSTGDLYNELDKFDVFIAK